MDGRRRTGLIKLRKAGSDRAGGRLSMMSMAKRHKKRQVPWKAGVRADLRGNFESASEELSAEALKFGKRDLCAFT